MSKQRRQQVLLAVSLGVLVVALWWRFGPLVSGGGGEGRGRSVDLAATGRAADRDAQTLPVVVDLRLQDLRAVSGDLEQGRDPFQVNRPVVAPAPRPEVSRDAIREAMERARREQEAEPAARGDRVVRRPPPVDVVFLGSFGPTKRRLAVFSDGSEIFNALEGEVLKDKFIVVRIGFESADLGFVGFPEAPAHRLEIGG